MHSYRYYEPATELVQLKRPGKYSVGIILGTGLHPIVESLTNRVTITYLNLLPGIIKEPNNPGHKGALVLGEWKNNQVVLMDGRLHHYEGYTMQEVVSPIRIMKQLGVETLIITSAVGGLHAWQNPGQVVVLRDHINFMGDSPLSGPNDPKFGPRFPDMLNCYDTEYRNKAIQVCRERCNHILTTAVYAAVKGPNLETESEYKHLALSGAGVVGMSVVPEVIAARHMGIKVLALSAITDVYNAAHPVPATIESIIHHAEASAPMLITIIDGFLETL